MHFRPVEPTMPAEEPETLDTMEQFSFKYNMVQKSADATAPLVPVSVRWETSQEYIMEKMQVVCTLSCLKVPT